MLRPNIDGPLEERIREETERDGFKNPVDFIRYSVRKELEERDRVRAMGGDR